VSVLLEDVGVKPKQTVVDLGFRGVDGDNPGVEILHRGKTKGLSLRQRRWLKRRLGGRTGDWTFEGGASNGAVLAERCDRRCLACRALRGGLQLTLADARSSAFGADRFFCALGSVCSLGEISSVPARRLRFNKKLWDEMDFAGATNYAELDTYLLQRHQTTNFIFRPLHLFFHLHVLLSKHRTITAGNWRLLKTRLRDTLKLR
jgi:hypothetical protein